MTLHTVRVLDRVNVREDHAPAPPPHTHTISHLYHKTHRRIEDAGAWASGFIPCAAKRFQCVQWCENGGKGLTTDNTDAGFAGYGRRLGKVSSRFLNHDSTIIQ